MNTKRHYASRLFKPSDMLLPAAFLCAAVLGRGNIALSLFIALYASRLCALSASVALRSAFARQPSMRYVQGSALLALLLQLPGTALAALFLNFLPQYEISSFYPFLLCGLLLNIEHVFYEYLFAAGDTASATLCRAVTSVLTLTGLLLCAPSGGGSLAPSRLNTVWPLLACGLSALVGLCISLALGGPLRPKMNVEVLRRAPLSMLQTVLYPASVLLALRLALPAVFVAIPLFVGWTIFEPWRSPFRRAPLESRGMNRALLIVSAVAAFGGMLSGFALPASVAPLATATCGAILLAALCAFALFGSFSLMGTKEE